MKKVFISLGANLGDRIASIESAYKLLELTCGMIVKKSSYYETPPWGYDSDQNFINSVVELSTDLTVSELLKALKNIESELGRIQRKNNQQYADRLIDLDIIDYDQTVISKNDLKVPHDKLHLRNFVLIPLQEIEPQWTHPILKKSLDLLIVELEKNQPIMRLK